MSWLLQVLARFVPGLVPAISALFNPWVLLAIGGAIVGAFFYGMHLRGELAEAFEDQVAAVGEIQEARTAARIARDQLNKERVDHEYEDALDVLSDRIAALVGRLSGNDPRGSLLPAAGAGAKDPDRIAFDRAELDRTLLEARRRARANLAGAAELVGEGAAAVVGLDAARRWNVERERQ